MLAAANPVARTMLPGIAAILLFFASVRVLAAPYSVTSLLNVVLFLGIMVEIKARAHPAARVFVRVLIYTRLINASLEELFLRKELCQLLKSRFEFIKMPARRHLKFLPAQNTATSDHTDSGAS